MDLRLYLDFAQHPKTKRLRRVCGDRGLGGLIRLWLFAAISRRDGDLSGMSDDDIDEAAGWHDSESNLGIDVKISLASNLHACGFLDGDAGNRRLHDWLERQPMMAKNPSKVAAGAIGGKTRAANACLGLLEPACQAEPSSQAKSSPSPNPPPNPPPKPEIQEQDPPPPSAEPAGGPSSSSQQDKPRRRRQADTATAAERDDLAAIRAEWDCLVREKSLTWRWKGADGEVLRYLRRNGGRSKLMSAIQHLREHPIREDKRAFEWTMLYIARAQDSQRNAIDRPAEILEGAWDDTEEEQRSKIERMIALRRQQQAVADAHH